MFGAGAVGRVMLFEAAHPSDSSFDPAMATVSLTDPVRRLCSRGDSGYPSGLREGLAHLQAVATDYSCGNISNIDHLNEWLTGLRRASSAHGYASG